MTWLLPLGKSIVAGWSLLEHCGFHIRTDMSLVFNMHVIVLPTAFGIGVLSNDSTAINITCQKSKPRQFAHVKQGDATLMPFEDGAVDVVWTQHTSMNIADKKGLYSELFRVLKPGGKLALYDVFKGPISDWDGSTSIHFPVPWAPEQSLSHLILGNEARELLKEVGFREVAWEDKTEAVIDWTSSATFL